MPMYYCINTLRVVSNKQCTNSFWEYVKSEFQRFDFNKILPIPEELESKKCIENLPESEINQLKTSYGSENSYEWKIFNWGTCDNCYNIYMIDENKIMFSTLRTPPLKIVQELSKIFCNIKILLETELRNEHEGLSVKSYTIGYQGEINTIIPKNKNNQIKNNQGFRINI